ncbi:PAAR domain-containing protein [Pendulispora brunnea]|uniref:PAAR domain-containing protein n=1 Tax=Pendulispora brunnea TaxID=2905690 RepID=A0ABZ2KM51_9BACT
MKNPLTMSIENPLAPVNKRISESLKEQASALDKYEEQNEWTNIFNKAESMAPDVGKLKDFYVEPDLGPEKHGYERIQQIRAEDKRYVEAWNYIKEIKKLTDETDKMDELIVDFAEQVFGRAVDGLFRGNLPLPLSMIAPAATVGSCFLGFPHTHQHPPSLTPPNPVPIPVMAAGPILTGNPTVLIGGLPAATAGELGMAIGCCSLSPYFKVFTGSHKVSIGGKRAARMGDVVKYCQPGPKVPEGEKAPAAPTAGATAKQSLDTLKETLKEDLKKKRDDKIEEIYKAGIKENSKKALEKGKELKAKYDTWRAAQDKAEEKRAAATEAPDDAQAQAEAAAAESAAEDATAIALADAELTAAALASNAMGMLRKVLENLLGKDPGVPPPYGMLLNGAPRVWIAGFPVPESSVFREGLKKLRPPKKDDAQKEKKLEPKKPSKRSPPEPAKQATKDEVKKEEIKKEALAPKKEGNPNAFAAAMKENMDAQRLKDARRRKHELFHAEKAEIIRERGEPKTKEEAAAITREAERRSNERELTTEQGFKDREIREKHATDRIRESRGRRNREDGGPPKQMTTWPKQKRIEGSAVKIKDAQRAREAAESAQKAKDAASQGAKAVPK